MNDIVCAVGIQKPLSLLRFTGTVLSGFRLFPQMGEGKPSPKYESKTNIFYDKSGVCNLTHK